MFFSQARCTPARWGAWHARRMQDAPPACWGAWHAGRTQGASLLWTGVGCMVKFYAYIHVYFARWPGRWTWPCANAHPSIQAGRVRVGCTRTLCKQDQPPSIVGTLLVRVLQACPRPAPSRTSRADVLPAGCPRPAGCAPQRAGMPPCSQAGVLHAGRRPFSFYFSAQNRIGFPNEHTAR